MISSLIWAVESRASRSTVASSTTGVGSAPMVEVAPGLRRWTAYHEHWEEQVGSLALETDDGLVLIDPIDPPRSLRSPDHVLLTVFWHGRSTAELKAEARLGAHALRAAAPQPRRPGDRRVQAGRRASRRPGGVRDRPRERGRLLAADAAFARGRRRAARRRRQAARNARRAAVLPGALARQGNARRPARDAPAAARAAGAACARLARRARASSQRKAALARVLRDGAVEPRSSPLRDASRGSRRAVRAARRRRRCRGSRR